MMYGLLLHLKFARVDKGNVSKKGEYNEGIITWNIFTSWLFNWTLSSKEAPIQATFLNIQLYDATAFYVDNLFCE